MVKKCEEIEGSSNVDEGLNYAKFWIVVYFNNIEEKKVQRFHLKI